MSRNNRYRLEKCATGSMLLRKHRPNVFATNLVKNKTHEVKILLKND